MCSQSSGGSTALARATGGKCRRLHCENICLRTCLKAIFAIAAGRLHDALLLRRCHNEICLHWSTKFRDQPKIYHRLHSILPTERSPNSLRAHPNRPLQKAPPFSRPNVIVQSHDVAGVTIKRSRLNRAYDMIRAKRINDPAEEVRIAARKFRCKHTCSQRQENTCTTEMAAQTCGRVLTRASSHDQRMTHAGLSPSK